VEVYDNEEYLYLVMELIRGGELDSEVINAGPFNEMKACKIFSQIVEGVKYLHSIRIVHRDLKLENILLNDKLQVKLSDFGLSKILDPSDEEFMKTRCGTPSYVAPEILLGEAYTPAVDLWSLGVILYLMVFAQYPFQATSIHQMYEKIIKRDLYFPSNISLELRDLIEGLLTTEVKDRITLEGIANHPWMWRNGSSISHYIASSNSSPNSFSSSIDNSSSCREYLTTSSEFTPIPSVFTM